MGKLAEMHRARAARATARKRTREGAVVEFDCEGLNAPPLSKAQRRALDIARARLAGYEIEHTSVGYVIVSANAIPSSCPPRAYQSFSRARDALMRIGRKHA